MRDGHVVGAVRVSTGTVEQDQEVSEAVAPTFLKVALVVTRV